MSVIDELATSLNRRDEVPNKKLAQRIVKANNKQAVKELIEALQKGDKNIQADCIKVLYEVGAAEPTLIRDYLEDFILLLQSKNNRLVWGSMMALNSIAAEVGDALYKKLPMLIDAANSGSVITRDNLVSILTKLAAQKKYEAKVFPLLVEQMATCPTNQLPTYAENAFPVINEDNKSSFIKVLQQRLGEIESETKKARVLKVIKKVNKNH